MSTGSTHTLRWRCLWWLLALGVAAPAWADWVIPSGAVADVAGGAVRLGCTDLYLDGALALGAGGSLTEVRNVFIGPAGSLQLEGGLLELAQQWQVQGNVDLGGGQVLRVDDPDCPAAGPLGPIGAPPPVSVPTLGSLALACLALLLAGLALRHRRYAR